eukprot:236956-Prorocentrum_lima.AAC.1
MHLPEQKVTIHMINQLLHETCSRALHDLAHVVSQNCLSDCLTKHSGNNRHLDQRWSTEGFYRTWTNTLHS